ncbi:hypothetical protein MVEG_10230 [Podila verticillata NRRL 6337]|nr:hypothetical protein MVEG_10230 [Podila verticillata NRRL 6337]
MGAYEAAKIANERAKELLQLIKPEPIDDQRSPLARRINALDADRGSIQEQKQNESSAQRVTHQEKENGVPLDGGKQRKKRKYKSIEKRKQSLAKEKGSLSQELDQNKLMLDVWKITMQEPITQVLSDMSKLNEDYFKGETAGEPAVESVIKTSTEEGPVNIIGMPNPVDLADRDLITSNINAERIMVARAEVILLELQRFKSGVLASCHGYENILRNLIKKKELLTCRD